MEKLCLYHLQIFRHFQMCVHTSLNVRHLVQDRIRNVFSVKVLLFYPHLEEKLCGCFCPNVSQI